MAKIADVQEVSRTLLIPYERNAKIHSEEQVEKIANSIKEFGFVSPCLIDRDYNIIAGHGRVMAAELLGLEKIPCVFIEGLSEEQRRAYILADNRLTELGDWDMEIVDLELNELNDLNFDISVTGFELEFEDEPKEIIEDEIPENVPTRCNLGDIWQLGDHRLLCGDCTDEKSIRALMGSVTADISITSPPYGMGNSAKIRDHYEPGKENRGSLYIEHDDDPDTWFDLMTASFAQMKRASVAQFINVQMLANNKRSLISWVFDNVESFVDVIVWDKTRSAPQMHKNVLNNQFEFVFIFSNVIGSRVIPFGQFHGNISNIIELSVGQNEFADIHRAVYPVELPAKIMGIASEAETVLDVFGGTGTTLIACEQLGRKCYMMELDPHYCDVIIERWEKFTGEKAVKL